jgi:ribonuclease P protein component
MLPTKHRLRHEKDFARLSVKGRPFYGSFCVLRVWKSGSVPSKIGFVASGKLFKTAVERNRIRRRMSEIVRTHLNLVPNGFDLTVVAKPEIRTSSFEELKSTILHLLEKFPKEMEKPWVRRPKPPRSRTGAIAYAKQLGIPRPPSKGLK